MNSSAQDIRRRLLTLLVRIFLVVTLFALLVFFGFTAYVLTYQPDWTQIRFPFISLLEGYYTGHGSWDGVANVVREEDIPPLKYSYLLDEEQRIVLDHGVDSTPKVGTRFELTARNEFFRLEVRDETIGYLVLDELPITERLNFAAGLLIPMGLLSIFLAMLLVLIASLLVRRYVNPLAEVIYAARAVADGKLDTRIPNEAPGDLQSLAESFNEMASSLERSDRERRDMLADIAHELRTPLSVIRGRLEGIVDGIYPENGSQVSTALEQTYLLERLVDDLRLLTLAETRQLAFDRVDVNVAQLIDSVIDLFSAQAQQKNITLAFPKKMGNLSAHLDPQRLEQVLSNLIGNALRYVPEGGRVWVTASETAEGLQITISDNGTGIPAADLPFIFDRFWRKDKSRSRASGGTGLGLAISRQLIEAQGGRIEAQNLPEGGLQVIVTFPR